MIELQLRVFASQPFEVFLCSLPRRQSFFKYLCIGTVPQEIIAILEDFFVLAPEKSKLTVHRETPKGEGGGVSGEKGYLWPTVGRRDERHLSL